VGRNTDERNRDIDPEAQAREELKPLEDEAARLKAEKGPDHPDTLLAGARAAAARARAEGADQALSELRRAAEALEDALGLGDARAREALFCLAHALWQAGERHAAFDAFERLAEASEAFLGDCHPDTMNALGSLSKLHFELGRPGESLATAERLLDAQERAYGEDSPLLAGTLNLIATVLTAEEEHRRALPVLRRGLAAVRGGDEAGTVHEGSFLMMISEALAELDEYPEALAAATEGFPIMERNLGPENPVTLSAMRTLAVVNALAGEAAASTAILIRCVEILVARSGPDDTDTREAFGELAMSLTVSSHVQESVTAFEAFAERLTDRLGMSHPMTLLALKALENIRGIPQ